MDEIIKKGNIGKRNKKTVILLIIAGVAALLFGGFLSLSLVLPDNVIAGNVSVRSIDLGGMTLEEAQAAIRKADLFKNVTLTLEHDGTIKEIPAQDISLDVDAEATAQKAFAVCKSGSIFKDSFDHLKLFFTQENIAVVPKADTDTLDAILFALGAEANGEMTDHQVTIADGAATIIPGQPGQSRDTQKAREEVLASAATGKYDGISVTLEKTEPEKLTADSAYELIHKEPQNAEYQYEGNTVTVSQSVVGCDVDKALLDEAVAKVNSGAQATVPVTVTEPARTTEVLQSKLFNSTLASYSTTFSTAAANRAANVELAASKINDTVLAPGQVFSYTEVLGNPSLANGFKVAPVYENGKSSQGVGGGVCQVSSTLYSAVLYADLEVVSRQNHSLTVAYLPKGQDATFAYGSIDFKFKNDTDYPIKVAAGTNGGRLSVSIVGTKRDIDRTVQLSHKIVSTTEPTVKQTSDATLPAGTKKVVSSGKTGYVVDTTKTVYENGNVVSSKVITRSTYKMVPTEVVVGTKAAAAISNSVTDAPTAPPAAQPPVTQKPMPQKTETPTPQTPPPATETPTQTAEIPATEPIADETS